MKVICTHAGKGEDKCIYENGKPCVHLRLHTKKWECDRDWCWQINRDAGKVECKPKEEKKPC